MYRSLNPDRLVATLETLAKRIGERFPGAGLLKVCHELTEVARQTSARSAEIAKPRTAMRVAVSLAMLLLATLFAGIVLGLLRQTKASDDMFGTLQGIDSGFNLVILMGALLVFLYSLEERTKRKRALAALHELRSIVHVIDMHQLTKDPAWRTAVTQATASSPRRTLTPFELSRYLDYCSEMLSLSAKVAALYAQSFPDAVVVDAVSDIERLTTNLSQKIWQKIMILDSQMAAAANGDVPNTEIG